MEIKRNLNKISVNITAGENIGAGKVNRISANNTVLHAQADQVANSQGAFGIAETDIANGANGNSVILGVVNGLFEAGLTIAAGETVYLSKNTAGLLTNVQPSVGGEMIVWLGVIKDTTRYAGENICEIILFPASVQLEIAL